jgi:hypothetical protein
MPTYVNQLRTKLLLSATGALAYERWRSRPARPRQERSQHSVNHGQSSSVSWPVYARRRESLLLEKAHQFEAVLFDLVDRIVFGPIDFKQSQLSLGAVLGDGPGVFHGHGGIRLAMHQ